MIVKSYEAESGHWYETNGTPAYRIIGANGVERNTTLRDAKKLNLVPSVTTIISQIDKPGLTKWKNEQLLLSALTLPRFPNESESDWLTRVMQDSRETSKQAAERGTNIHGIIESFMEGVYLPQVPLYCFEVEKALQDHFSARAWLPEHSFGNDQFGGKVDLHAKPYVGFNGAVCDVKTTEKDLDKVDVMFEHQMQLAAYRQGLKMPNADCAILYVNARQNKVKLIPITPSDLDLGWECFVRLLEFYRIRNKLI